MMMERNVYHVQLIVQVVIIQMEFVQNVKVDMDYLKMEKHVQYVKQEQYQMEVKHVNNV